MIKKIIVFVGIIFFIIAFRVFVGEAYEVSSSSMDSTLVTGNWVWVSKTAYGARMPSSISEVPFGLLVKALFRGKNSEKWDHQHYSRVSGTGVVRRYDVVLLKSPYNLSEVYVKRCIGLPGEHILATKDSLYLNYGRLRNQITKINLLKGDSVAIDSSRYIPRKGDSIDLIKNPVFVPLIKKFEEASISVRESKTYINGKCVRSYKFKMNYFFVMGDNRLHSRDSRWFGLVPESCILGKVTFNISKFRPPKF
jgi:signal peptidase I